MASVSVAHQNRVLTTEPEELDLGATGVPGAEEKVMELVDTELSAELGAGALSPKSGTRVRYWPGVSWLMQPLYWVLW